VVLLVLLAGYVGSALLELHVEVRYVRLSFALIVQTCVLYFMFYCCVIMAVYAFGPW